MAQRTAFCKITKTKIIRIQIKIKERNLDIQGYVCGHFGVRSHIHIYQIGNITKQESRTRGIRK